MNTSKLWSVSIFSLLHCGCVSSNYWIITQPVKSNKIGLHFRWPTSAATSAIDLEAQQHENSTKNPPQSSVSLHKQKLSLSLSPLFFSTSFSSHGFSSPLCFSAFFAVFSLHQTPSSDHNALLRSPLSPLPTSVSFFWRQDSNDKEFRPFCEVLSGRPSLPRWALAGRWKVAGVWAGSLLEAQVTGKSFSGFSFFSCFGIALVWLRNFF